MSIDGLEVERRLRRLSQMRKFYVEMRREAQAAYQRGEWGYPPPYDIRSDIDYWKQLAAKKET